VACAGRGLERAAAERPNVALRARVPATTAQHYPESLAPIAHSPIQRGCFRMRPGLSRHAETAVLWFGRDHGPMHRHFLKVQL
jgi:hypothetical protein